MTDERRPHTPPPIPSPATGPRPRDGTWGRLGVYLVGVAIGLILLATFKMMSWQSRQQGQQASPTAPAPATP